ncbi:MAG: alpha/beta hydrolase [Saprospiraceae bacterium]
MRGRKKYITINTGIQLFYQDTEGTKPAMLFIHGLGTDHKCWSRMFDLFSEHYRCIAIDLPGYGNSSKETYPFSISFFVDTIHTFLKRLKIEKASICGHSMGGQIAIRLALDYPDSCEKLILLAPAGIETFDNEAKALIEKWYTPEILLNMSESQTRRNFEANFYKPVLELEAMILERQQMKKDQDAYQYFCNMIPQCVMAMILEPVFEELSNLTLPTTIFYGKEDALIPSPLVHKELKTSDIAVIAQKSIPHAKVHLLEACGHFIPLEKPLEVFETLD